MPLGCICSRPSFHDNARLAVSQVGPHRQLEGLQKQCTAAQDKFAHVHFHSHTVMSLNVLRQCRQGIEAKRRVLEGLQKKCTAAQAKLEGEYGQLGSLEAKTKELENLRKVTLCC